MNRTFLPILFGVLLSLSSALMLRLAFPPYNLGLLILVGFIPMLIAQYHLLPPNRSSLAPALTISGWLGALLIPAFGGKSLVMVILPLGIFFLVLATDKKKRAFHENSSFRWFVFEGIVGWVGLEMLRSFIPAIGTWAFVGYAMWNQPGLIQPLSIVGIYGLDLLIMLINYVSALVSLYLLRRNSKAVGLYIPRKYVSKWFLVTCFLLTVWTGLSQGLYTKKDHPGQTIRVAAIQPNLPRAAHRDNTTPSTDRLSILSELTRQAAVQEAQLVVWPEMAIGFDPHSVYSQEIEALAVETQTYLVIGYVLDESSGFRNETILLSPSGQRIGIYSKNHPMILTGEPKSINARQYPVFDTSIGRLGIMICFDASFTDVIRRLSKQGVQLIANPSLFGSSIADLTQVMPVFRAIESRSVVVMADVAYNSAIVDPYGRVVESVITPQGQQTILVADITLANNSTLYARFGDWLGWFSLLAAVAFAIWISMKRS